MTCVSVRLSWSISDETYNQESTLRPVGFNLVIRISRVVYGPPYESALVNYADPLDTRDLPQDACSVGNRNRSEDCRQDNRTGRDPVVNLQNSTDHDPLTSASPLRVYCSRDNMIGYRLDCT